MKQTINNDPQLRDLFRQLAKWDWSKPLSVEWKEFRQKRTIPQNSLYWMWIKEMSDYFSQKSGPFSEEEMHDLMRHQFLGYTDRKIGNTKIEHQLVSTTDLETLGMSEYMQKIEAWNTDHGLLLTIPAHSEYAGYREAAQ